MDNKEIALNLTITAINNRLVGSEHLIEARLVDEEIFDFYHSLLSKLDSHDEHED